VLLSFAQFEREVTGERIRDKIAASKQKGMWMGGIGWGQNRLAGGFAKKGGRSSVVESKSKSWVWRTCARAVTNSRMQASETRLGRGRANQFGSLPRLPT
jgi:DNA invertase Pin-like site-specific DNA recombinase